MAKSAIDAYFASVNERGGVKMADGVIRKLKFTSYAKPSIHVPTMRSYGHVLNRRGA